MYHFQFTLNKGQGGSNVADIFFYIRNVSYYIALHVVLRTVISAWKFTSLIDLFAQILPQLPAICYNSSAKTDTNTHQPLSIARYSLIQMSELEQSRLKKYSKVLKSLQIFRILLILVERPKLYDWITPASSVE